MKEANEVKARRSVNKAKLDNKVNKDSQVDKASPVRETKWMKPLSNTVFLGIFAHCENNPELEGALRGLLNAILDGNRPEITKIDKVQAEDADLGEHYGAKAIRIDLLVTDCLQQKYIVEIQLYTDLYIVS